MNRIYLFNKILMKVTFFVLSLTISAQIQAATAFYTGTFDPPTFAHFAIMKCALGGFNKTSQFYKPCRKIQNKFSRLIVVVNIDGEKDTLTSANERIEMIQSMLTEFKDKVEVVALNPKERTALRDQLAQSEEVVQLLGEDSFLKIPLQVLQSEKSSHRVVIPRDDEEKVGNPDRLLNFIKSNKLEDSVYVFPEFPDFAKYSSTAVRKNLAANEPIDDLVAPSVENLIRKHRFYQFPLNYNEAQEQKTFEVSYLKFIRSVFGICKSLTTIKVKRCTELLNKWKKVEILNSPSKTRIQNLEDLNQRVLAFKPGQSKNRWAEKFFSLIESTLSDPKEKTKLLKTIKPLCATYFQKNISSSNPRLK